MSIFAVSIPVPPHPYPTRETLCQPPQVGIKEQVRIRRAQIGAPEGQSPNKAIFMIRSLMFQVKNFILKKLDFFLNL